MVVMAFLSASATGSDAGQGAFAVHQNGACAAAAFAAAVLRARQAEVFAKHVQKGTLRICGDRPLDPVDCQCHRHIHMQPPSDPARQRRYALRIADHAVPRPARLSQIVL